MPSHEDRRASLSISVGNGGTVLVKCHAGCETSSILSAVGMNLADLFPAKLDAHPVKRGNSKSPSRSFPTANDALAELERRQGQRSALWTYQDAQGEPIGMVVRWDKESGKDIRPVGRHVEGWRITSMPEPRQMYCLPQLGSAQRVLVVEGEKAADAARSIGFTATTSSGGSQAARMTDWTLLAGKEVWILPDNDPADLTYAESVVDILTKLTPAPVIRLVDLPALPDGGDIVEWIEAHGEAAEPDGMQARVEELAQAVEQCQPVRGDDLAYRPFPVDALPDPIRGFVSSGEKAIGCDLCYLALPLLTSLGAAIGNTRRLELKRGWAAPAIIWGAMVGESGTAKTPAFRLVMRPVRERQRKALLRYEEEIKQFEVDMARWEKEMTAWKRDKNATEEPPEKPEPPHAERFIVADTTVEALAPILLANPRGVLLGRDELNGSMGSFDRYAGKGGADAANWLSMVNAESINVDKKTGIPRTVYVPHAALCVCGGIQPTILQRALGTEHRESGLAARLLLTCPPRKPKQWTEADIDPVAEAELVDLFDLQPFVTEEGEARPLLVRLTPEAHKTWTTYYNRHADEQADLTGDLSAAWSKLEEYAARLALVIHFTRWAANDPTLADVERVDLASMSAAIRLTEWFKHEARRVYAILDESDTERDQRRLTEWIERKGGPVSARQVQQGCRWLKESEAAEAALTKLVKAGKGSWIALPTTQKGGRPGRQFVLLRPSTVYESPRLPGENEVA